MVRPGVDEFTGQVEPLHAKRLAQALAAFIGKLTEAGASMIQINTAGKAPARVRFGVEESCEKLRREMKAQQYAMRGPERGEERW